MATIYGTASDDTIYGNAAEQDTMLGGMGNDTYHVEDADDVIVEYSGEGIDDAFSTAYNYVIPDYVENLMLGSGAVSGYGNSQSNQITGNSGDNFLDGLNGNDVIVANDGNDTLQGGGGDDSLYAGNGIDSLIGGEGADILDGGAGNDYLYGGSGENTLSGGDGDDFITADSTEQNWLEGGNGDDAIYGSDGDDIIDGGADDDNLKGVVGDDLIQGGDGEDDIDGGVGTDTLSGGAGSDTIYGGGDNDIMDGGDGNDQLLGNAGSDQINGGAGDDVIFGEANGFVDDGGNILNGEDGDDTILGAAGGDVLNGGNGADIADGAAGNDTIYGGGGNDAICGGDGLDQVMGGDGADIILCSVGADTIDGGAEEDMIYYGGVPGYETAGAPSAVSVSLRNGFGVKSTGTDILLNIEDVRGSYYDDLIEGDAGNNVLSGWYGIDTVTYAAAVSAVTVNLAAGTATGDGSDSLDTIENVIGSVYSDYLTGDAGANRLDGGTGADTLSGGGGDDTYIVDSSGDVVSESSGNGDDFVQSSVNYTLGSNLERLILTGTAANASGNTLANTLTGNASNNVLNGNTGADTMTGGLGDDAYYIDNAGDLVIEGVNEGTDRVFSYLSMTLVANLEILTLLGTANLNGTAHDQGGHLQGNTGTNILTGGLGNDTLNGGAGSDTLIGGDGNDTYYVDSLLDVTQEAVNGGADRIYSSISWTLAENIEYITLNGVSDVSATGNELNNSINGNAGNNVLNGEGGNDALFGNGGADTLLGGGGNDAYYVADIADVVIEYADEGSDRVYTSINWTLSENFENLTILSGDVNGAGNALANSLTGSTGHNMLTGGLATDSLFGGLGNDTYVFARGDGLDYVTDADSSGGNADVLSFLNGVNHDQLWFKHVSNNLEVSVIGAADKVVIKNWYLGTDNHLEQVRTAEASENTLLSENVEALVAAMASLTPPPLGQTELSASQHAALDSVIAASWS